MYVSHEITIGLDDHPVELELVVRSKFTATVRVQRVHWWRSTWRTGTPEESTNEYLYAEGRWLMRSGDWSTVDARSEITEEQLPPDVLAALHRVKAGVE